MESVVLPYSFTIPRPGLTTRVCKKAKTHIDSFKEHKILTQIADFVLGRLL